MLKAMLYLKQKNSIFLKTLVSYIIIFTIPLLVFGTTIYSWVANIMKEQTTSTYVSIMKDIKNDMDTNFESMEVFSTQLSYLPWVSKYMNMENSRFSYDHIDIIEMLNALQELGLFNATYDFVDDIAVYFNGKDTLLSTRGKDSVERYFQDLIRYNNINSQQWHDILSQYNNRTIRLPEDVYISNYPTRLMTYVQSLPPGDKSFSATLLLFINEDALKDRLRRAEILKNSSIYVLDADNKFVTGLSVNDEMKQFVAGQKYPKSAGSIVFSNDEKYSLFYSRSDKNGWKYISAVPIGIVMSKINFIRVLTALISIFYLSIGLLISYRLTMKNYRPLENIIDVIRTKLFQEKKVDNEFEFLEDSILSMLKNTSRSESENRLFKPLARNTCLIKLLKKETDLDDDLLRIMSTLGISFKHEHLFCAVVLLSKDNYLSEPFQNLAAQKMAAYDTGIYFVEFDDRNKGVIFNTQRPDTQRELVHALAECLRDASLEYRAIGSGNVFCSMNDLHRSYKEANVAVDYRFIRGDGCVMFVDEINFNNDWIGYIPEEDKIISSIKSCDAANSLSLAREVINRYLKGRQLSSGMIKYLCYTIASMALKASEDMNISNAASSRMKGILMTDSFEEMTQNIESVFSETCSLISREKESHNNQMIDEIIGHINSHYADSDLTLTRLANTFGISSSYLSRFFKNQTGYNFIEYLNKKRVEASQKLLLEDMTVMQVAQKTGFDNDITFRRVFKKYTGKTPGSFKN